MIVSVILEKTETNWCAYTPDDFGVVISGEAVLELDDKEKVTLRVGDTYVQNGTRHRWSNKGEVPCVIAVVLIGAHHSKVP